MSTTRPSSSPADYTDAVARFIASDNGWASLDFFRSGKAAQVANRVDARQATGAQILPPSAQLFTALVLTPPEAVKVVILGQDPYPTPGDAHGLAFSVDRDDAPPRSLRNIFREMADDLGLAPPDAPGALSDQPGTADRSEFAQKKESPDLLLSNLIAKGPRLTGWARQGVLLLNASLTVEAGAAGAHRTFGWDALAHEAIATLAGGDRPVVFILWGADARKFAPLIAARDVAGNSGRRHLVIESAHPSPLSARRGFFGSRPFSQANAFLEANGRGAIDWGQTG